MAIPGMSKIPVLSSPRSNGTGSRQAGTTREQAPGTRALFLCSGNGPGRITETENPYGE